MATSKIQIDPFLRGFHEKIALLGFGTSLGAVAKAALPSATGGLVSGSILHKVIGPDQDLQAAQAEERRAIRERILKLHPEMYKRLEAAGLLDDVQSSLE